MEINLWIGKPVVSLPIKLSQYIERAHRYRSLQMNLLGMNDWNNNGTAVATPTKLIQFVYRQNDELSLSNSKF